MKAKNFRRNAIVLALAACTGMAVAAPSASSAKVPATTVRAENAYLTQAEAANRAARVSNVEYTLAFTLTGGESFSGDTSMAFDLADASQPLTIDLDQADIASLTVNGKAVTPQYNKWFITIAPQDLVKGRNTVEVRYTRLHATNGEGLHRMVDPVDHRVYTYSHFEPAAAHKMFALFDQPDLKATYQITVTVPADWVVSSTNRESKVQDVGASKVWTFPRTKKLSPYNFSMHAGPYKVWEDHSGPYPLRLFARQSVASQVSPQDWFKYTRAGLAFFDNYFGIPYQFEKYDQLLVPDFLYGAMENAGAITFAEHSFLHQEEMTAAQRQSLASVIMHEMAHQWFGDLVTMQWWNGLWLNESFASFMATLATAEATEFPAWQSFYSSSKQAAYVQDQRVTTHPIETPVPSTANAFDNIDAITYSKGASTLKQLRHLLGEEVFRQGVHNYLVKYSYQNAKLEDFIGSLGEAAHRDLSGWTHEWLYQPGVDTLTAQYVCKGGKIASFNLHQTAPGTAMPTLREQRVQVGLFHAGAQQMELSKNVAVIYKGADTKVPQLVGEACPDLVYPNYQDWGFVKVQLDKKSFATAQESLGKVQDPLLRSMLWQSLWDGVRDGHFPLNAYLDTVLKYAPAEHDYTLLGDILGKVRSAHDYLALMGEPAAAYRAKVGAQLEQMAFAATQAASNDSNFQRRWFSTYVYLASSKPALEQLAAILDGKLVVPGLNVSQDVRWDIVTRLNRYAYPGADALLAAEQQRDKSDAGELAAIGATVGRPDAQVKAQWLATIADQKTALPFSKVRKAMENIFPAEQSALSEQSAVQRLAQLPQVDQVAGPVYMRSYGPHLIPASCTPASVQRLQQAVDKDKELSTGTRRNLLISHQEDARCVAIKKAMTVF